jgi:hypothetical protein
MLQQTLDLIEHALRHFPLRGFGNFDDLVASDDGDRFLLTSFWRAFSRTFSVSAAKPITSCESFFWDSSFRMSGVASSSRFIGPLRLSFCPAADFGR